MAAIRVGLGPHCPTAMMFFSVFISLYRWFQCLEITDLAGMWDELRLWPPGLVHHEPPTDGAAQEGQINHR